MKVKGCVLQAVQVIQQLTTTETDLRKRKRRLTKRRDGFLCSIAPATGLNTEQEVSVYSVTG